MAKKEVTVWDAAGIKRTVRSIDAAEIVANGGSTAEPGTKPVKAAEPETTEDDETAEGFPNKFPGAAALKRAGIGYHAAMRMTEEELIAVDGIAETVAHRIIALR